MIATLEILGTKIDLFKDENISIIDAVIDIKAIDKSITWVKKLLPPLFCICAPTMLNNGNAENISKTKKLEFLSWITGRITVLDLSVINV